jgi:hypothetical protein
MNLAVNVALFGWPVVVLVLFAVLPARRAVIVSMLGAWLFLPIAGYAFPGFPDITKMSVTCVSVFIGTLLFDPTRLSRIRWSPVDLVMLVWILAPLPGAIDSGYGVYEGISGAQNQLVSWGMPYMIGRLYFSDPAGLRELAFGIFVGGLVYTPFVLFEARMSPQLHTWVYGFHQHSFAQARRGEGWRATVFMQHGLAVAMFMGTAAVCGMWFWAAAKLRTYKGVPVWALASALFVVVAISRSSYALILMLAGMMVLFASRMLSTRLIVVALLMATPLYLGARTVGGWDAQEIKDAASMMGTERLDSLTIRLGSEDAMWQWIQGDLLFGRGRLTGLIGANESEYGRFVADGMWVIALGRYGLLGMASMFGVLLLPTAIYLVRFRPKEFLNAEMAGATALMIVLVLYAMDNLLNAMWNPIYLLASGGLVVLRPAKQVGLGTNQSLPLLRHPNGKLVTRAITP